MLKGEETNPGLKAGLYGIAWYTQQQDEIKHSSQKGAQLHLQEQLYREAKL